MGLAGVESRVIVMLQERAARPPVVSVARALSGFGEHSLGWLVVGAAGAVADRRRARAWAAVAGAALVGHAAAVGVKRVVRRPRPASGAVRVWVSTPSALSFPSAHAASTTAAAVALLDVWRPAILVVPAMALSRVILGVHYPSDVAAGCVIGAAVGLAARTASRGSTVERGT